MKDMLSDTSVFSERVSPRAYGRDWATVGYRTYDHSKEEFDDEKETRKVRLTKRDLSAAKSSRPIVRRKRCLGGGAD